MLDRGVALAPGAYEVLFVGTAHTDDVLDEVVDVAARAAVAVACPPRLTLPAERPTNVRGSQLDPGAEAARSTRSRGTGVRRRRARG